MIYQSLISNYTATSEYIFTILEKVVQGGTVLERNQQGEVELITYELDGSIYHITNVIGHPICVELDGTYLFKLREWYYK